MFAHVLGVISLSVMQADSVLSVLVAILAVLGVCLQLAVEHVYQSDLALGACARAHAHRAHKLPLAHDAALRALPALHVLTACDPHRVRCGARRRRGSNADRAAGDRERDHGGIHRA